MGRLSGGNGVQTPALKGCDPVTLAVPLKLARRGSTQAPESLQQ